MSFSKRATFFILLGFIFLLNSCHSIKNTSIFGQGIKTVRASKQVEEKNAKDFNTSASFIQHDLEIENNENEVIKTDQSIEFQATDKVDEALIFNVGEVDIKQNNPDDSLTTAEKEYISNEALETEDLARKAKKAGLTGLILSLIPFLGFFGLILSIIGLSKSIRALRAPYITEDGLEMARTGLILSIISLGLRVLAILLLVILILVLI